MSLSKEQWFNKLKTLVPRWVFEEDKNASSVFWGMAAILQKKQEEYESHVSESYIDNSSGLYLAEHGKDRNTKRSASETESSYKARIKNIINSSDIVSIKNLVNSMLIRGKCTIIQHHSVSNFANAGAYANRNIIDFEVLYNAFTILVYHQIPEPNAFANRGLYTNREFLGGASESQIELFNSIVEAVNKNIVFGTVYRLIERPNEE